MKERSEFSTDRPRLPGNARFVQRLVEHKSVPQSCDQYVENDETGYHGSNVDDAKTEWKRKDNQWQ